MSCKNIYSLSCWRGLGWGD